MNIYYKTEKNIIIRHFVNVPQSVVKTASKLLTLVALVGVLYSKSNHNILGDSLVRNEHLL
jgi:hypothetical protein